MTDSVGKNDANWEENSISRKIGTVGFVSIIGSRHMCPVFPWTGFLVCFYQSKAGNVDESGHCKHQSNLVETSLAKF